MALALLLGVPGLSSSQVTASTDPAFALLPPAGKVRVERRTDPTGRATVELPTKDWRLFAGGHNTLLIDAHNKGEATLVLEVSLLTLAQPQSDVDDEYLGYRRREAEALYPSASGMDARIVEHERMRVAVLQFLAPGVSGQEIVRTYVFLDEDRLFRLTCRAPSALFTRHEAVCAHAAATFKSVRALAAAPAVGP